MSIKIYVAVVSELINSTIRCRDMYDSEVRTAEQALVYMTDCTLATVADMAMRKRRAKGEYRRQTSIAQKGVDWIRDLHINPNGTRVVDVMSGGGSVVGWARMYEP